MAVMLLVTGSGSASFGAQEGYDLTFSTFIGRSGPRGMVTDAAGSIYVAGTTGNPNFPTTPGAYDRALDTSKGTKRFGYYSDIFVMKLDPIGNLLWSTLLGGPGQEEGYGVQVDANGYVFVHGRGAPGSPTTPGVFQPTYKGKQGTPSPGNPHQSHNNAYVAKLSPDGSQLVWASYFGQSSLLRSLAVDRNGDVYLPWGDPVDASNPHDNTWQDPAWFANAFQKNPVGGADTGVAKVSGDGTRVMWATYLCGSGHDWVEWCVRVDGAGYVYCHIGTDSRDMPTTADAHDRTFNGGKRDSYLGKLTPDGSSLVYGTYIGGSGVEYSDCDTLALDSQGNAYVCTLTSSADYPTTPGAFQTRYHPGGSWGWDSVVTKISPTGRLLASTYLGAGGDEVIQSCFVDKQDNIWVSPVLQNSRGFPVTPNAFQATYGGGSHDGAWCKLASNLTTLLYSTYMGGSDADQLRAAAPSRNGGIVVSGFSMSSDWPTTKAYKPTGPGGAVAKFAPTTGVGRE